MLLIVVLSYQSRIVASKSFCYTKNNPEKSVNLKCKEFMWYNVLLINVSFFQLLLKNVSIKILQNIRSFFDSIQFYIRSFFLQLVKNIIQFIIMIFHDYEFHLIAITHHS